jgi:hypothetical protein
MHLRERKVNQCGYDGSPLDSVLSLLQSTFRQNYFSKMHFNIIILSGPRSSQWYLLFTFLSHSVSFVSQLSHACPPVLLACSSQIIFVEDINYYTLHYVYSLFSCHFLRSKESPHHFLLERPSSIARDQASH